LSPDATGTYNPIGPWNSRPSYKHSTNDFYIWWDGFDTWLITVARGDTASGKWSLVSPDIEGVYTPTVPYTGDATVAELV